MKSNWNKHSNLKCRTLYKTLKGGYKPGNPNEIKVTKYHGSKYIEVELTDGYGSLKTHYCLSVFDTIKAIKSLTKGL